MTRPRKNPGASGIRTRDLPLSRRTLYHWANEAVSGGGIVSDWTQDGPKTNAPPVFSLLQCLFRSTPALVFYQNHLVFSGLILLTDNEHHTFPHLLAVDFDRSSVRSKPCFFNCILTFLFGECKVLHKRPTLTIGVSVDAFEYAFNTSAFLACHQCYCAGSSLVWDLNLRA